MERRSAGVICQPSHLGLSVVLQAPALGTLDLDFLQHPGSLGWTLGRYCSHGLDCAQGGHTIGRSSGLCCANLISGRHVPCALGIGAAAPAGLGHVFKCHSRADVQFLQRGSHA